jgi:hypothetical protein
MGRAQLPIALFCGLLGLSTSCIIERGPEISSERLDGAVLVFNACKATAGDNRIEEVILASGTNDKFIRHSYAASLDAILQDNPDLSILTRYPIPTRSSEFSITVRMPIQEEWFSPAHHYYLLGLSGDYNPVCAVRDITSVVCRKAP